MKNHCNTININIIQLFLSCFYRIKITFFQVFLIVFTEKKYLPRKFMFFVLEEKLIQKLIRKLNYVYIIKNGKSNFKLIEKIIQKIVEMLNINIDQNIKLYFNNGSKKITTLILIIFFQ